MLAVFVLPPAECDRDSIRDDGIFTARCYAERGYATVYRLSVRPSVRPSLTFRYRDHMDWNTLKKIISRLIRLRGLDLCSGGPKHGRSGQTGIGYPQN